MNGLLTNLQYFWRVRAVNPCGVGPWSAAFAFTTGACFGFNSVDVPVDIPAAGAPIVFSSFNTSVEMTINDVNIINLQGAHSWVDDLKMTLISPDGTEQLFWNRPCANHDDFNIQFDDEAPAGPWPCPPIDGLTYRPDNTLSVFDGENSLGEWMLKIEDIANQDGGSLNSWGLRVCGTITCQLIVTQLSGAGAGSLPAAISCAQSGDTVYISAALANQTINIGAAPIAINKNVHIKALGAGTTITGTGVRVFDVGGGQTASFLGLTIRAGTSLQASAFSNLGVLRLHNTTVERNPAFPTATLIENREGSQCIFTGDCQLNQ
jgi:subtilisin-like proprotein convertase family protein